MSPREKTWTRVGQAWTKYPLIKYKYTILNPKIGGILSPLNEKLGLPRKGAIDSKVIGSYRKAKDDITCIIHQTPEPLS